jgi:hypothetical protein
MITVLLTGVLSFNSLQAQLLKKLKKRVQETTEDVIAEKAAQKAAQESGKALDSLLDIDPEYQANYEKQLNIMMAGGNDSIHTEDSYEFKTQILYRMTTTGKDKTSEVDYEMWFDNDAPYMATRVVDNKNSDPRDMPASVLTIMDNKNNAMIVLMEKQKMAQVISMKKMKDVATAENETEQIETELPEIKKTGNTKKIMGYQCEEFVSENKTSKYSFWVTRELALFQKNMFFNMSKSLGGNTFDYIPEDAQGLMMEMNYEDFEQQEKGSMKVVDIQKTQKSVSMSDYQLMNMGNWMQK